MGAEVQNRIIASSLALYIAWALGCATTPEPTERLATAKAGVRSARELGSSSVPDADLHVKLAEEQIQMANKLIEDGDNERAEQVLLRAAADAELAVALTREKRLRDSADANAKVEADKNDP